MDWKITWTDTAWNDLTGIYDFISKDSPHYAGAIIREIRDASRTLSCFAERGRIVPEFGLSDLRELFVRHYRLIYKITQKEIFIVALIHGARDLKALWDNEQRPY